MLPQETGSRYRTFRTELSAGKSRASGSMFTAGGCMAETAWKFITDRSFRQQVEEDFRKADHFEK